MTADGFLTLVYLLGFTTLLVAAMRAHKRADPTLRTAPPASAVVWAWFYTLGATSAGVTLFAHVLRQVIS